MVQIITPDHINMNLQEVARLILENIKKLTATKLPVQRLRALTKDLDLHTPTMDFVELSNSGASSIPEKSWVGVRI